MTQRASELEIYKSAYLTAREIHKVRSKMARSLKYDVGSEMMKSAISIIRLIVRASRETQKEYILKELLTDCELLWSWLRLGYDV